MANAAKKIRPSRDVPITEPDFVPEHDESGVVVNDPDAPPATEAQLAKARPNRRAGQQSFTLAMLRQALGVTQVELAERSGINQAQVSRTEKAEDLLVSTLRKYAAGLGCEVEVALVRDGQRYRLKVG